MTSRAVAAVFAAFVLIGLGACEQRQSEPPKATADDAAKAKAVAEAAAKEKEAAEAAAREKEALDIAIDAYVYGYPLITMEYTRRVSTNVAAPQGDKAPMGQFAKLRQYPNASFRTVTAPNADTLYTVVWLDVSNEPWIVSIPNMKGRYALFPMLDGWTTVFEVPGKRTTGTAAQRYAITGPGWSGKLPAGVKEYKSPTGMVWLLGRIYCTGTPQDYKAVHALQNQMSVVPLSAYGKRYKLAAGTVDASVDIKTSVRDQVNSLDAVSYFKLLAELMKKNPPSADDAPMVAKLGEIGIVPGQDFDASKLDPAVTKALAGVPKAGQERITAWFKESVKAGDATYSNGWLFSTKTGIYGTDYVQRAMITWFGLGANRPQDAVYPTSEMDAEGQPYSGANRYVIHFNKGEMPPVDGFWSLTMYNSEYFFLANPLNRYNVSSRSRFKRNKDGSVDIYIQNESPGKDKQANWLPAPKDRFILMLRMYWPREKPPSIIDGTWKVPPVTKAG
jgi:hypothetical protein